MEYENLLIERDGGVVQLRFDSTSRFNSVNPKMAEEMLHAFTELGSDDDVRCIVIRGNGESFCSGADLAGFDGDERDEPLLRRMASLLHDAVIQLHQAEVPVVVGIDAVAAGAGFSLALAGDVILISDEARMEYAYGRIGLTGDGGSTFLLPRIVGLRTAKEIALLDEPISPERAVELGIATEVVSTDEFDDRLLEMAERLASGPAALGVTKRLMTESFDRSYAAQLAEETDEIAKATHTEDYERGFAAFFSKEEAEFVGR